MDNIILERRFDFYRIAKDSNSVLDIGSPIHRFGDRTQIPLPFGVLQTALG